MTLSEMAVLAIDEILLRTEISGRGEEGARRRAFERGPARVRPRQARPSRMTPRDFTSERVRRGYGRDKRGPPARRRATSLRNGSGAGTAATSAALPHDAARLHFGTGPARVRPRQARPSRMTPRGATSPHRHKMRFHCVINLESRRGVRRDPFGRNELRSSPGLSWRLQARREAGADTFPVLAHHLPLKIYISVMSLSASQDLHFRNVPVHLSGSTFP